MPAAAIMGGAAVGSAFIGSNAAKKASQVQAQSARDALALQQQIYQQNQQNNQGYIDFGKSASASLAQLYGLQTPDNPGGAQSVNAGFEAFKNLPAFKFPYEQGMRALTFKLNAEGRGQSGAEARETQQFGQGLASQYMMSNYVDPLTRFADMGRQAAGSLAGANTTMGNYMGNMTAAQGAANASGIVGSANAITGGINSGANNLMFYSALAKNGGAQPGGTSAGGGPGGSISSYQSNPWSTQFGGSSPGVWTGSGWAGVG